jgi:23S rRNA pseudouridine1911/1915/1917 synthase
MNRQTIAVPKGAAGERLDVFVARQLDWTRSQVQRLIRGGAVSVAGDSGPKAGYELEGGEEITVEIPEPIVSTAPPPDLRVIYEDEELLVVDKPAGLSMHPGSGTGGRPTVADFARAHTTDPDPERPGIVHRLDMETSGLVIIAKTVEAKAALQRAFAHHEVNKTYIALVVGRPDQDEAIIRLPLDRDPKHPLRRTVATHGREAVTRYQTLANYPGYTLVQAFPETGRTHQLRVHFATLGHPIAGDTTYGPPRRALGLQRHFLHAARLSFTTPAGQSLDLASDLPDELAKVLRSLGHQV